MSADAYARRSSADKIWTAYLDIILFSFRVNFNLNLNCFNFTKDCVLN